LGSSEGFSEDLVDRLGLVCQCKCLFRSDLGYTNINRYVGEDEEGEWAATGAGFPDHDEVLERTTRSMSVGARVFNMGANDVRIQDARVTGSMRLVPKPVPSLTHRAPWRRSRIMFYQRPTACVKILLVICRLI
jgi:hypothetical protein